MLTIGISGVGSIGLRHARLLSQRKNIKLIVCDCSSLSLEEAKKQIVAEKFTLSFEEMINSKLDGLLIAAPDKFHTAQLEVAFKEKIVTLVEKPLAESYEQGKRCFDKLNKFSEKILVGYPLRFSSVMQKTKELLPLIGTAVSFHAMLGAYQTLVLAKNRFSDSNLNKLFVDYSHEWDYIACLLGKFKSVIATKHMSGELEFYQNPNVVDCLVKLESGVTGTVHLDYVQDPSERSIFIIGDKGTLKANISKGEVILKLKVDGFLRKYDCIEHRDEMFIREHDNFISIINNNAKPLVSLKDALDALAVATAMIKSSELGQWQFIEK